VFELISQTTQLKVETRHKQLPSKRDEYFKSLTVLMDRLHWQSLLAKLSATATRDSH
jgi:hypothetical protein